MKFTKRNKVRFWLRPNQISRTGRFSIVSRTIEFKYWTKDKSFSGKRSFRESKVYGYSRS